MRKTELRKFKEQDPEPPYNHEIKIDETSLLRQNQCHSTRDYENQKSLMGFWWEKSEYSVFDHY